MGILFTNSQGFMRYFFFKLTKGAKKVHGLTLERKETSR